MTPSQKRKIDEFWHPATIERFIGRRNSKSQKKSKMVTLYAVAIDEGLRQVPPGSWLIQMDRKIRNGEP